VNKKKQPNKYTKYTPYLQASADYFFQAFKTSKKSAHSRPLRATNSSGPEGKEIKILKERILLNHPQQSEKMP
jgi:hypothetical protein